MRLEPFILTLAVAGAAAAQPLALPPTPAAETAPAPIPVTPVALIYTASDAAAGPRIEPWTEERPATGGLVGARVDYFTVEPAPIRLAVGETFDFRALDVAAHGLDGEPVAGAPLRVELEAPGDVVDVTLAAEAQRLRALRPGVGRLWIESVLPRGTGTGERFRLPVVILVRRAPSSPAARLRP